MMGLYKLVLLEGRYINDVSLGIHGILNQFSIHTKQVKTEGGRIMVKDEKWGDIIYG